MPKRKSITGDNSLVPIRKKEVPKYLRNGAFYQSLNDDDDEEVIMVPGNAVFLMFLTRSIYSKA